MTSEVVARTCPACDQSFLPSSRHLKCPKCRAEAKKHPCPKCGVLVWRNSKTCYPCADPAAFKQGSGADHPKWKGGRIISKKGYVLLRAPEHPRGGAYGYVAEHVLVMERHLGRFLLTGENVHHVNGVKADNRLANLELWTTSQPAGQRASDLIDWAHVIVAQYDEKMLDLASSEKNCLNSIIALPAPAPIHDWSKHRRSLNHAGYVYIAYPEHPTRTTKKDKRVFEHVLVMENRLGRLLLPNENVHHMNGVKDDNRPDNLELWVVVQPSGQRVKDKVRWARELLITYALVA